MSEITGWLKKAAIKFKTWWGKIVRYFVSKNCGNALELEMAISSLIIIGHVKFPLAGYRNMFRNRPFCIDSMPGWCTIRFGQTLLYIGIGETLHESEQNSLKANGVAWNTLKLEKSAIRQLVSIANAFSEKYKMSREI